MLECGKNFRGTLPDICTVCSQTDDENHRLNHCKRLEMVNLLNSQEKMNFEDIHSNDFETVKDVINKVAKVWNVKTGNGVSL